MRILVVHNHYQLHGGEDESYETEVRMLREGGQEVLLFTEHNNRVNTIGSLQTAWRTVWSAESYGRLRDLLREQRPDIMHVQNFFPLISPSIYYAARAEGVPVVQSLRNYRLLCPNALFFRDGHVCEDCMHKSIPWPGIVHACYRDSRPATAAVGTMLTLHHLMGSWANYVDHYIALTRFARNKFIEGGLPGAKITVKPNFVHPDPGVGEHRDDYALFVGRLSKEKGIMTLLQAWRQAGCGRRLRIVGGGPLQALVETAAQEIPGVEYWGSRPVHEVYDLMADAGLLVLPSEWYETFGRVAVEAFAKGIPVIAANIGAVAEIVAHGRTGLLFTAGDSADLGAKLCWAWHHPERMARMGREARNEYAAKYTAECNYKMLMDIYTQTISRAASAP